jgi:hypothetical protein
MQFYVAFCYFPVTSAQTFCLVSHYKTSSVYVGFEVLTAVVIKSSIFWDITSCSPLKVNRTFEGICRRNLQGQTISEVRNQREAGSTCYLRHAGFSLGLFFDPEDVGNGFLRNVGRLQGIISQKTDLGINVCSSIRTRQTFTPIQKEQ